jgi:ribosomal protein L40E
MHKKATTQKELKRYDVCLRCGTWARQAHHCSTVQQWRHRRSRAQHAPPRLDWPSDWPSTLPSWQPHPAGRWRSRTDPCVSTRDGRSTNWADDLTHHTTTDSSISQWIHDYMEWMELKPMTNIAAGTLEPHGTAKRTANRSTVEKTQLLEWMTPQRKCWNHSTNHGM